MKRFHEKWSRVVVVNPNPRPGICNLGYTQMAYGRCNFRHNDGADAIAAETQCLSEGGHLAAFDDEIVR